VELAILFWCYKKPETCAGRVRLLRHYNPDKPIYVLFGGNPAEAHLFETEFHTYIDDFYVFAEDRPPFWKWKNGDMLISRWFSERGHRLKWDSIVIAQWDMLMFAPVEQLFLHLQKNEVLLSGALPMKENEQGFLWWLGSANDPQVERWWRDTDDVVDPPSAGENTCREVSAFLRENQLTKQDLWWCIFIVVVFPRKFLERFSARKEPETGFLEYTIPTLAKVWGFDICTRHSYNPWHGGNEHMYDKMLNASREECPDRYVLLHLLDPWGDRIFHPYSRDVNAERLLHALPAWLNFLRCKDWNYADLFGDSTRAMARHAIAGYDLALPDPVTTRPAICLSMIVRNEARGIAATLDSVAPYVSSWMVVDTGSDDGTQELIKSHMARLGIPGELCQRPSQDIDHSRSEALTLAREHGDYIWIIGADETLEGTPDLTALGEDIYWLRYVDEHGGIFWCPRLLRDGVRINEADPIYEYAARDDEPCLVGVRIEGDYHFRSRHLGARNLQPQERFAYDRDLLLAQVERNPQDAQSVFLLAQRYFDLGDFVNARKWYARRIEMVAVGDVNESDINDAPEQVAARGLNDWNQIVYYSMFRLAQAMANLGEPWPDVQDAYLKAWEFRPTRAEPLHAIAVHYRCEQDYELGHMFAERAAEIPLHEQDTEFVRSDIHNWAAIDEQIICASWLGQHAEAFALSRRLLARPDIPDAQRQRIAANRDFSVPAMFEAAAAYPDALAGSLFAGPRDSEVTVSLIAGPDQETTEQALNSFLNCCTDVSRIGRFLVVYEGVSALDRDSLRERAALRARYGFVEIVDRGRSQGPGAELAQLREQIGGRFWLHIGQGWQFFAPENLITRLTAVLEAEPQVFQVGINLGDAANVPSTCAAEDVVHRAPDAGRYVLSNAVARGPAMFDTTRLDRAGGVNDADHDPMAELERRAAAAGLQTATLDEVLCRGFRTIRAQLPLGDQTFITVIGRGHSGTRAIAHTLAQSGVFMGGPLNDAADLEPKDDIYEACRIIARHIPWRGGLEWDFGPVQTMPIPEKFAWLIERYLTTVLASPAPHKGWKIPETTLCYPWITRLFPEIRYIYWVRNPLDCMTGAHVTDDLRHFGVEYPPTDDEYLRRAISWKYQEDLVAATPRPRHWIEVRLEDFVQHQERELARLEEFLGLKLARIPVVPDVVDRYKKRPGVPFPEFLKPAMREHGYEVFGEEKQII
jgi:glycosyltransferase involved in cell wall biosynthesis